MTASQNDYFLKGTRRFTTTLSSSVDDSTTTIPLSSVTNLPTDTGIELSLDRVDSNGALTLTKEEVVRGYVSGASLINCVRGVEGTAQAHAAGAVVESRFTADDKNRLVDGIMAEHNQDGTHKSTINHAGWDGWVSDAAATRTGNHVFTLVGDRTADYRKGTRVKFTDTTTKYGVVISAAYTSVTTVTLLTNTDYLIVGTPSALWFSNVANPVGYPGNFNYSVGWTADIGSNTLGDGTLAGLANIIGSKVQIVIKLIWGASTSSTGTTWRFSIPVAIASSIIEIGNLYAKDATDNKFYLMNAIVNTNIVGISNASSSLLSSNVPITFAASDEIYITAQYLF